jgi:Na+/melibiose symporter-like transporter
MKREDAAVVGLPSKSIERDPPLRMGGVIPKRQAPRWVYIVFPRPVFRRRWLLAALIVPGLLLIPNNLLRHIHRFYMPWQAVSPGPPWIFKLQLAIEIAYLVAALIVFGVAYSRLKDAYERRRLRTVFYGALVSFSALVVFFWLLSMTGSPILLKVFAFPPTLFLFLILWSVFPLAFGYTALRDGRRPESRTSLPSVA